MPLDYKILNKKPIITRNGVKFQDLAVQTIDPSVEISGSFLVVNKYYVARPDLIALAVYGDDRYADILCKVNGISNPFELNEGLIIVAPDINDIYLFYQLEDSNNTTISSSGEENKQESAKAIQKKKNEPRKANEQVVGDRNFRIDKNNKIVIY